MLRVLTSNRAISLQNVAIDIVKTAHKYGVNAVLGNRITYSYELRRSGDDLIVVMAVDPLVASPWMLLCRDCCKGGVRNLFYGTIEGRVNTYFLRDWMRDVVFVANSNYVRDKLVEAGLNVVDVVHHGIDLSMVSQAINMRYLGIEYMRKLGIDPSKHVVVTTISNSHPRKGLAWYDSVIELVGMRDGSIKFLVITEEKGLKYFSRRGNLVVSTDFGKLPRITILSIIATSHILAIPSLSEGFGLPALEAMALGTPVVHAELPPLMEFSKGWSVPIKEILYFNKAEVGPSGIIYEQYMYDVKEFSEVILQVVDILRNKKEEYINYRIRSYEEVLKHSIFKVYSKLLKLMGYSVVVDESSTEYKYDMTYIPTVPPPQPPIPQPEKVDEAVILEDLVGGVFDVQDQ